MPKLCPPIGDQVSFEPPHREGRPTCLPAPSRPPSPPPPLVSGPAGRRDPGRASSHAACSPWPAGTSPAPAAAAWERSGAAPREERGGEGCRRRSPARRPPVRPKAARAAGTAAQPAALRQLFTQQPSAGRQCWAAALASRARCVVACPAAG